jgi:signal transduction histidine kinase
MRSRWAIWAGIWLGCTVLGTFFGTTLWLNYLALGRDANFGASLTVSLVEWWIWALLAPIPILAAGRFPLGRPRVVRDVAVHAFVGIATAVTKAILERLARTWLFGVAPYVLPGTVALHFLIYWAIVAMALAAAYYRQSRQRQLQASQLEARLSEARLDLLRSQLQPHFIFNSLNTVAELIHEDPERADRMLAGLGDLLRTSLDASGRQHVPLRDELGLAERYLAIHTERYGDRLAVRVHAPDDCLDLPVPHFILQPLVENALVHGIAPAAAGGHVHVTADRVAGYLELIVEDSGVGFVVDDVAFGVGLSNTRLRLEVLHGGLASIDVQSRPGGGTRVVLRLPVGAGQ